LGCELGATRHLLFAPGEQEAERIAAITAARHLGKLKPPARRLVVNYLKKFRIKDIAN
jgi:hypothetical protein